VFITKSKYRTVLESVSLIEVKARNGKHRESTRRPGRERRGGRGLSYVEVRKGKKERVLMREKRLGGHIGKPLQDEIGLCFA